MWRTALAITQRHPKYISSKGFLNTSQVSWSSLWKAKDNVGGPAKPHHLLDKTDTPWSYNTKFHYTGGGLSGPGIPPWAGHKAQLLIHVCSPGFTCLGSICSLVCDKCWQQSPFPSTLFSFLSNIYEGNCNHYRSNNFFRLSAVSACQDGMNQVTKIFMVLKRVGEDNNYSTSRVQDDLLFCLPFHLSNSELTGSRSKRNSS